MESQESRLPTEAELQVMEFLLSVECPAVGALRMQVVGARVQTNCTCGCGSFDIDTDESVPAAETQDRVTPTASDRKGAIDMFLFVTAGRISAAEITYYDRPGVGVPEVANFTWN